MNANGRAPLLRFVSTKNLSVLHPLKNNSSQLTRGDVQITETIIIGLFICDLNQMAIALEALEHFKRGEKGRIYILGQRLYSL